MKIMIGLLGKPSESKKPEGGLLESDKELPEAMTDEAVNKENKKNAILKANYGPSEDKMRYCGNCEYFNMDLPKLSKGEGFCEMWEFKCRQENLCAAYEFNEPEAENDDEYDSEYDSED